MSGSGFSIPPYMQQNSVGSQYSLNGELPPEIALKEQALNRRQQIANLMTQNSMRPLQGGMAGRFYVPPSAFQGLAQLGEAAGGAYINSQVDKGRADLAGENQKYIADAIQSYQGKMAGTPAQPGQPMQMPAQGPGAPEMVNALASRSGAGDPGVSGKLPDLSAPVAIEGPQPTNTVTGPETPAMPATPEQKQAAMIELLAKRVPGAQAIIQMQQRQEDMKAQQDFQSKEHALNREQTASQKEADRENRLAMAQTQLNQMVALKIITQGQADDMHKSLAKQSDETKRELATQAQETQKQIAAGNNATQKEIAKMNIEGRKDVATTKASTPKAMSPTTQKELFETEDTIAASQGVIKSLGTALDMNKKAYDGAGAGIRSTIASNIPLIGKEGANATVELDNIVTGQALQSLRSAFGSNPTEGERKILLDVQGSVNMTAPQREAIWTRAKEAADRRLKWAQSKAKQLRDGSYFGEQNAFTDEPAAAPAATSGWTITPIP